MRDVIMDIHDSTNHKAAYIMFDQSQALLHSHGAVSLSGKPSLSLTSRVNVRNCYNDVSGVLRVLYLVTVLGQKPTLPSIHTANNAKRDRLPSFTRKYNANRVY